MNLCAVLQQTFQRLYIRKHISICFYVIILLTINGYLFTQLYHFQPKLIGKVAAFKRFEKAKMMGYLYDKKHYDQYSL